MRPVIRRLAILAALLLAAIGHPAAKAAPTTTSGPMYLVILAPLVHVYEGDTLNLGYMVTDSRPNGGITLAPLTPGAASVTAVLGVASVTPEGMTGKLTYTAQKAGQETITVTATNYYGSVTGSMSLEIKPRPNYNLDFVLVSEHEDPSGGAFLSIFTGTGEFANVKDAPLTGQGTADLWFSLWAENAAFNCSLNPPIQGATGFEITGVSGGALVPGSIEPFLLNLNFQPLSTSASTMSCAGLGGITASFPWPATQSNPNDQNPFQNLFFPGEGGTLSVTADKTWGTIWVTRK
ncbi:MAG TPA: hypothetical protein PKG95_07110 [Anaerolineaceae bacterium]|jgi:hypothetical protein|nr:hypothetical protein [Anaerolineaceae bacterium]